MDFMILGPHRLVLWGNVLGSCGRRAARQVMESPQLCLCVGTLHPSRGWQGPQGLAVHSSARAKSTCGKTQNKYINWSQMTGQ